MTTTDPRRPALDPPVAGPDTTASADDRGVPAGAVVPRPKDDLLRAATLLIAVAGDVSDLTLLVIDGPPPAKARPRFGRGGRTYTPAESRAAEARTSSFLRQHFAEPMTGNVALACVFYRPDRQRIDADNMLKHVCDAANGIIWLDDSQTTAVLGIVELDAERPRTVLAVAPHDTTMTRGTDAVRPCEFCGKPISIIGSSKRFCNATCKAGVRSLAVPVACAVCGADFRRRTQSQKYCSQTCVATTRRQPRPLRRADRPCQDCGQQVSRAGYERCRDCWKVARSAGLA